MENTFKNAINFLIELKSELYGKPVVTWSGERDGWYKVAEWGSDIGHTPTRVQMWAREHKGQILVDEYFGLETSQYKQYEMQIRNAYEWQKENGTRSHNGKTENVLKWDDITQCEKVSATWGDRYGKVKNAVKDITESEVKTA